MSTPFTEAVELLLQIHEDQTVPKNIREHVKTAIQLLEGDTPDPKVKVSKALDELDSISDDTNIPIYTRTQVWQAVSLLESHK